MLRTLTVRDFVIVDTLELDFTSGFSAMTGETGAGKSILIDALQLVLGGRGDATMVRETARKAEVTAEFELNPTAAAWLTLNDIDSEDGTVLLRRSIDATSGRSRCYINGTSVTANQMRTLGALLVDIHGQHAHQLLMKADEQRILLDRHAGLEEQVAELGGKFRAWLQLQKKVEEAQTNAEHMQEERERLAWQVEALEKIQPQAGEWEQINQDYDRLSHAASLLEGAGTAVDELSESDRPILSRLSSLTQTLSSLAEIDKGLEPVVEMMESSCVQLQEVVYSLRDYLTHTELDPSQLQVVEKRMETLHAASRQFRIPPESLPEELETRRKRLQQFEEDNNLDALKEQAAQSEQGYRKLADQVSASRKAVAEKLSDAVTAIMQDLHMAGGRFAVSVQTAEPHAYGTDHVEFMVAGHEGAALRPLAKVASGGELARISLAISVIASKATATPTLIFDEVDTGVGGAVAEIVGQLLKRLGSAHQVLCVTHLPQVASQADQHYQVSKQHVDAISHPVSRINRLADEERVIEIARMLGGVELTDTALDHAREMLGHQVFTLT